MDEELMLVAWHPNRWYDWCMSEDEKKEIETICTNKVLNVSGMLLVHASSIQLGSISTENYK